MDFTGKVCIITGGASGIGRATVLKFARLGASVAVVDINIESAQSVVAEVENTGGVAFAVKSDITIFEQALLMSQAIKDKYGHIDVLVNNVGWDNPQPFMDNTPSLWDRIIDINLKGSIYCTRAALEHMIEQREGGKIINVASDAGRVGVKGEAVYSAAKGAVVSFTKAIAREMAEHDIRVNCTCPSATDTPLTQEISKNNPKTLETLKRITPLRRISSPEEQANAIVWLASDEASYITGQVLSVNGGINM